MDSFANVDVNYPDGQTNKTVVPAEIQARGFKPPVRTASGELVKGDNLAANHLNFILNDIYNKFSNARLVTESNGNTDQGYRKYSNGDVDMWGFATPGTDGTALVTYPVSLPEATRDIMVSILTANNTTDINAHSVMIMANTWSTTGFRAKAVYKPKAAASDVLPSQNGFMWRATYHAAMVVNNG